MFDEPIVVDDGYAPVDRQIAQLRVPPHSIEAESSVLGGLLLDNHAWDRVVTCWWKATSIATSTS